MKKLTHLLGFASLAVAIGGCELYLGEDKSDPWTYCGSDGAFRRLTVQPRRRRVGLRRIDRQRAEVDDGPLSREVDDALAVAEQVDV